MVINPKTLKLLRERKGFTQQDLAHQTMQIRGGAVSKRQIGRIETGATSPDRVRRHTVESLAKALDVTVQQLTNPDDGLAPDSWQWQVGYRQMKIKADVLPNTPLNYQLVMHHYGVSFADLVDAAPWMFTLLAELSLADRRRRLEATDVALKQTMPEHLQYMEFKDKFDDAREAEMYSIMARDIFGKLLPIDFDITNPFVEYVRNLAREVGSEDIDPDQCACFPENRPSWQVFEAWCQKLTNGNIWARYAIDHAYVLIDDIPDDLKSSKRALERAGWLASKVPAEERAQAERESEERRRRDEEMSTRGIRLAVKNE